MFILKKLLTPFFLPPGIFVIILIFTGIWFLYKRYRVAGITNIFIGIFMWSISIAPLSDAIIKGLEYEIKMPENPQGDAIILLGGGVYDEVTDLSGIGAPSEEMMARLVTAVRLQKKLNIPVIISGGAVFKNRATEAPIVKRFLVDLEIPDSKIMVEDRSRDTIENARHIKEICMKMGFKKPLLVTSAMHMKRSILSFKKAGMDVVPVPANFKTWEGKRYGWHDYLPLDMKKAHIAIHEYLGLLFYKFAY